MSKYCPIAKQVTNCTDNCKQCLEEEEMHNKFNNNEFYAELLMEQQEQM